MRFYVMETLKDWYRGGDPNKKINKLVVGGFGLVAGAVSVFGNTPVDVVKTRWVIFLLSDLTVYLQTNRTLISLLSLSSTECKASKRRSTRTPCTVQSQSPKTKDQWRSTRAPCRDWAVSVSMLP